MASFPDEIPHHPIMKYVKGTNSRSELWWHIISISISHTNIAPNMVQFVVSVHPAERTKSTLSHALDNFYDSVTSNCDIQLITLHNSRLVQSRYLFLLLIAYL